VKKILFGAALAASLLAAPALAQTAAPAAANPPSRCGAPPAAPEIPDGATSNRATMDAANAAYQAFGAAMQQNLACRRAEVEELEARKDALTAEHNAAVAELQRATDAITAEATEFNARR
jgi:hypothetical protein